MAENPITDTEPIIWDHRDWSLVERLVGGESHRPVVGFVLCRW
jgi:hypothetical protein